MGNIASGVCKSLDIRGGRDREDALRIIAGRRHNQISRPAEIPKSPQASAPERPPDIPRSTKPRGAFDLIKRQSEVEVMMHDLGLFPAPCTGTF